MIEYVLQASDIVTGYGKQQVINNISLALKPAEIIGIIGPNGSGKSTLIKAICGLLPLWSGETIFRGSNTPIRRQLGTRGGIAHISQHARIFPGLTVRDNIALGDVKNSANGRDERFRTAISLFPFLADRLDLDAAALSGGEQQAVSLTRAMISAPSVLVADEPTIGLDPRTRETVCSVLWKMRDNFDVSILLVEQSVPFVLDIADILLGLKNGRLFMEMDLHEKKPTENELRELYL